jgi:hypothetical protein
MILKTSIIGINEALLIKNTIKNALSVVSVVLDLAQSYSFFSLKAKSDQNNHCAHLMRLDIVRSYYSEFVGDSLLDFQKLSKRKQEYSLLTLLIQLYIGHEIRSGTYTI